MRFRCVRSEFEQDCLATAKVLMYMDVYAVRAGIIFVVTQFYFRGSRRATKVVGASRRFDTFFVSFFSFLHSSKPGSSTYLRNIGIFTIATRPRASFDGYELTAYTRSMK